MALPSRLPLPHTLLRNVAAGVAGRLGIHPKAAGLFEYGGTYAGGYLLQRGLFMPWELDAVLDPEFAAQGLERLRPLTMIASQLEPYPRRPFARVATLESSLYLRNQLLRDADWASMAHSLEVRVPLVDSVLLEKLAPLELGADKVAGKRLMADAPTRPLPVTVTRRAKTGFTTPVGTWMAGRVKANSRPTEARPSRRALPRSSSRPEPWARGWARLIGAQIRAGL